MRTLRQVAFIIVAALTLSGCDDGTGPDSGSGTLVGTWLSAGYDLAPGVRAQFTGRVGAPSPASARVYATHARRCLSSQNGRSSSSSRGVSWEPPPPGPPGSWLNPPPVS